MAPSGWLDRRAVGHEHVAGTPRCHREGPSSGDARRRHFSAPSVRARVGPVRPEAGSVALEGRAGRPVDAAGLGRGSDRDRALRGRAVIGSVVRALPWASVKPVVVSFVPLANVQVQVTLMFTTGRPVELRASEATRTVWPGETLRVVDPRLEAGRAGGEPAGGHEPRGRGLRHGTGLDSDLDVAPSDRSGSPRRRRMPSLARRRSCSAGSASCRRSPSGRRCRPSPLRAGGRRRP